MNKILIMFVLIASLFAGTVKADNDVRLIYENGNFAVQVDRHSNHGYYNNRHYRRYDYSDSYNRNPYNHRYYRPYGYYNNYPRYDRHYRYGYEYNYRFDNRRNHRHDSRHRDRRWDR